MTVPRETEPGRGADVTFSREIRAVLVVLLLAHAGTLPAAVPFAGDPPVARFTPDLDVYPQNFALAQSPDGVLYVGNSDGVLTFDGERWQVTPLPNGDIVRSLAADDAGRVYVGGYNQFGWLERDAAGREQFHDLTPEFRERLAGESFADIWSILVAPEGVFFRALHHLFLYRPQSGEVMMWRRDARYGGIVRHGGDIILQFRDEGLRRFVETESGEAGWEALPGTESMTALVHRFVPLPDGGLLALSKDGKWRRYDDGVVRVFAVPDGFPPSSDFTRGILTGDNRIALSTTDGALVILDPATGEVRRFEIATGFISALIHARGGGIFMASDDAILLVDWPARWTVLGKEHGLTGSPNGLAQWNGRWFVLTGAGVSEWLPEAPDGRRFATPGWSQHAAWDLLALDDGSALLAENYAVKLLRGERLEAVTHNNFYPRLLQASVFDPDTVYAGTELGFAVLRKGRGGWRAILELDDLDAPRVNSIVQTGPRELWLGTDRGGVMRLRLAEGLDAVASLETFDAAAGIAYDALGEAFVTRLADGELIASTARGIFRHDGERFVAESLGGLDALRGEGEFLKIARAPDGSLWAYSFNHVFSRKPDGEWREHDLGAQLRGAIAGIAFDRGGGVLLASSSGTLRYRPVAGTPDDAPAHVSLRAVELVRSDGTATRLPLHTAEPLEFGADDVNIAFRFSLPEYGLENGERYSARLDGLEPQWSKWSASSGFMYYRMRPGSYELKLRARDSSGHVTEIEPWRFRVVPHWYASTPAAAAWTLLSLLAITLLAHWILRQRTSRLAGEKARLETMVAERTQELEEANRKLDAIAHLDGLTGISNRRRLDAYLEHVWTQCAERERSLSVLVIDVDHFKRYNDRHGHVAGDRLLQKLAKILARCLRRSEDLVARYGGEEFLAVLPGADLSAARDLANFIRETVESSSLGATVSIGLAAAVPGHADRITDLVRKADAALYEAKAANRNCVRACTAEGGFR